MDAVGAARLDRGDFAAGVCQLSPARLNRQPCDHRANFLRGCYPTRARDDRRPVLEAGQPPRRVRGLGHRDLYLVLHAGAAIDCTQPWLALEPLPGPGLAARQPAGPANHTTDPRRGAVAGGQLHRVCLGVGAVAHTGVRALAGGTFHRSGNQQPSERALDAFGANQRFANPRRTLCR